MRAGKNDFAEVAPYAAIISALLGSPQLVGAILFPAGMAMAAMFFTSLYFTFDDSFEVSTGDPA